MRVFKTKWFMRYARQERIKDQNLCDVIKRADRGLVDADLGGGIIKQRVARTGQGRSGGFRLIIAYRSGNMAVFLHGFAKSEQVNIEENELKTLQEIGAEWLKAKKERLEKAIKAGIIAEVICEDQ